MNYDDECLLFNILCREESGSDTCDDDMQRCPTCYKLEILAQVLQWRALGIFSTPDSPSVEPTSQAFLLPEKKPRVDVSIVCFGCMPKKLG